jgi:lipopolysaccharide transport system ATP-binding protein
MQDAILVENVGKRFQRYHAEKPSTLMEAALKGFRRVKPLEEFWALRGVSFEVAAGEMIGVIGHNGAGKSTLLQLLGKVAHPNEGRIKMQGRVGALLDLGAGFHGDLTGRENVFVTAIVAGLPRREVARRFDRIVEFAELQGFIDNPVRTYSTGMIMRLAFSVAVHTDPQILLVDEFLSVGDLSFQAKCLNRIAEMKGQGCAIVLVSHDVSQVERLCDRALWLKQGTVMAYGEPTVVAGQYTMEMRSQTQQRTPHYPVQLSASGKELRVNENRFGSLEAEIVEVRLLPHEILKPGDPLSLEIDYQTHQPLQSAIFSIAISQENGDICLDVNTLDMGIPDIKLQERGTIRLNLDRIDLRGGHYFVDVGIYQQDWTYAYDYHWHVYPLILDSTLLSNGILTPPMRWEIVSPTVTRSQLRKTIATDDF